MRALLPDKGGLNVGFLEPDSVKSAKFVDWIKQGGVLFWLRCSDDQVARANNAVREHQSAVLASCMNP